VWGPDAGRDAVPVDGDGERAFPDARRGSPGAPKGNSHAFKHGRYSAEAIGERREVATLMREIKGLVEQADGDE
jgi:hypothetical protein